MMKKIEGIRQDKVWGYEVWYEKLLGGDVLVKIIEAHQDLSIQVHPDDALAQKRGLPRGKTEMWYILDTAKDAKLIDGFCRDVTREEYLAVLAAGKLEDLMHYEHVKAGDVYFIPAGRVHALGGGLRLVEIQQTSDTTYRVYDYNRPGLDGKLRQLHTEEALDALDFSCVTDGRTQYKVDEEGVALLADCSYFKTTVLRKSCTRPGGVYLCSQGTCMVNGLTLNAGDCVEAEEAHITIELPQGSECIEVRR